MSTEAVRLPDPVVLTPAHRRLVREEIRAIVETYQEVLSEVEVNILLCVAVRVGNGPISESDRPTTPILVPELPPMGRV